MSDSVQVEIREMGRSPKLASALAELGGVTLAELRTLMHLDELAERDGGKAPARVLADAPVWVGQVKLYLPTLGALTVLEETMDWWRSAAYRERWMAYVLAHGRDREALGRILDGGRPVGLTALHEWLRLLPARDEEIRMAALAAMQDFPLVGPSRDGVIPDAPGGRGWLSAAARAGEELGGALDYWLWEVSAQRVCWIRRERENAAVEAEGQTAAPGLIESIKSFNGYVAALRRQRQQGAAASGQ